MSINIVVFGRSSRIGVAMILSALTPSLCTVDDFHISHVVHHHPPSPTPQSTPPAERLFAADGEERRMGEALEIVSPHEGQRGRLER